MKLVTLKTFDDIVDLHIMKTKLEDIGITTYIFDENVNSLYKLNTSAIGGFRLQISDKDLAAAIKFINEENSNLVINTCPNCNSSNIEFKKMNFWNIKTIFNFLIALLFLSESPKENKVCKDCGYVF
ncbi:MAG: putative signal transducing protein [Candidatus Kapaibacteriota bacterium]